MRTISSTMIANNAAEYCNWQKYMYTIISATTPLLFVEPTRKSIQRISKHPPQHPRKEKMRMKKPTTIRKFALLESKFVTSTGLAETATSNWKRSEVIGHSQVKERNSLS